MANHIRAHSCVILGCIVALNSLTGCGSGAEPDPTPIPQAQTPAAPQNIPVRYRITGITGKLTGTYTGTAGTPVAIEGATGMNWETTVQIPVDILRANKAKLEATTDTGTNLNIEIYAEGQLRGSQSGTHPSLEMIKH